MGKEFFKIYRYSGELNSLADAINRVIKQMCLKPGEQKMNSDSFLFYASEKMKWLTTNWPVHFGISAKREGEAIIMNIRVWTDMFSITQDIYTKQKADEFLELVKAYAPDKPGENTLEILNARYAKGDINKEEYDQIKKDIKVKEEEATAVVEVKHEELINDVENEDGGIN